MDCSISYQGRRATDPKQRAFDTAAIGIVLGEELHRRVHKATAHNYIVPLRHGTVLGVKHYRLHWSLATVAGVEVARSLKAVIDIAVAAFEKMRINLPGTKSSPQALPVDAPLSRAVVVEDGHDVTCALVNDQDHILDAIHCTSKVLPNV